MPFTVIITQDFDQMSETAAGIVIRNIQDGLREKAGFVLGLATGNSPTGLYKHLAKACNDGTVDAGRIRSFNLDEYIGLPGENAQQRALHPESYSFFMIQELFGLLKKKFGETSVPWGTLVDQERLAAELKTHPEDWSEQGEAKGRAIRIRPDARSDYLRWIRRDILDAYREKIEAAGGIDLHVIGVGGHGHVAFHESGIPFAGNDMLLVRLDENTVENAVADGHFARRDESPCYAVSMGAELVYRARTVLLLANGTRKTDPIAESLLNDPTPFVPISYGQIYARQGGNMIYVLDRAAAAKILDREEHLRRRGIAIEDLSRNGARIRVAALTFARDPATGQMG